MAKRYHIAHQNGYIVEPGRGSGAATFTKAGAQKALAEIVRDDAAACRRTYKRCSVVGSVRSGSVEIKVVAARATTCGSATSSERTGADGQESILLDGRRLLRR